WPIRLDFLPFIDLCLQYLRPVSDQQLSVEPAEIYFGEFTDAGNTSFVLAQNEKEISRFTADEKGRLRFAVPDEPGIYQIFRVTRDNAQHLERMFCVNPGMKESQLEYEEGRPAALNAWIMPPSEKSHHAEQVAEVMHPSFARQVLWWYLLAAAAILLLLESLWLITRKNFV
ncbi:MAG: hypothetical protein ABIP97_12140, partial [Chthoniobacterales bacterium]